MELVFVSVALGALVFVGSAAAGALAKALSHKYLKRVPYTARDGKRKYRYWYKLPGSGKLVGRDDLVVGAAFQAEGGHYHVTASDIEGGNVTVRHDETGKEATLSHDALAALLHEEHKSRIAERGERLRRTLAEAEKVGNPKMIAARKKDLAAHVEAYEPKPEPKPAKPARAARTAKPRPPLTLEPSPAAAGETRTGADRTRREHVEVGEHVYGSRADLAAGRLPFASMTEEQQKESITKARMVPAFDADALRDSGATPGCALMTKFVLASIASRPANNEQARLDYADGVPLVLKSLAVCRTVADVEGMLEEWRQFRGFMVRDQHNNMVQPNVPDSVRERYDRMARALGPAFAIATSTRDEHNSNFSDFREYGKVFAASIAANALDKESLQTGGWDSKAVAVALGIKKDLDDGAPDASKKKKAFVWQQNTSPENPVRVGGRTSVDGADAVEMARKFNLKNVQFGNWISDEDATHHLEACHGALLDLADVLGIEPQQLSHGGRLSIAIGARGKGNAVAHYEPGAEIINLTKFLGGGSLAHEMGHFIDHQVARDRGHKGATSSLPPLLSETYRLRRGHNRPTAPTTPVERAAYGVVKAMFGDAYHPTNFYLDASALPEYWSRAHECFARCFAAYVEDTLAARGARNTYLVFGTAKQYRTGVLRDGSIDAWVAADPEVIRSQERLDALRPGLMSGTRDGTSAYGNAAREHARLKSEIRARVKGDPPHVQPYPQGEERARINAAMAELVTALRDTGALRKAFGWDLLES